MKVKELIEELQKYDDDKSIKLIDAYYGMFIESIYCEGDDVCFELSS